VTPRDQAEQLAAHGWFVFPSGDKKTHPSTWPQRSTVNPETFTRGEWDNANFASIDCGKSGICVLDIDDLDRMPELEAMGFNWGTMCQHTPSGGRHYIYRAPPFEQRNAHGVLLPKVDIKGAGGLILWYGNADLSDDILPWPLFAPVGGKEKAPTIPVGASVENLAIGEGNRNDSLYSFAAGLRAKGLEYGDLLMAGVGYNSLMCDPPLAQGEVRQIVTSALRYDPDPGPAALFDPPKITPAERMAARLTPRVILPGWLYADIRTRNATGGVGKTTVALWEACRLACGRSLYWEKPERPVRTVLVTKEDNREIMVGRLDKIATHMGLSKEEDEMVNENIQIIDLSGIQFRLNAIGGDMVILNDQSVDAALEFLTRWRADWAIFDPLVSFGVGEEKKNDAAQGIIEAFKRMTREADCCVEGIGHVPKDVLRNQIDDALVGRGGSALGDGSRMVVNMMSLTPDEWRSGTGSDLGEHGRGVKMTNPKNTYHPSQPAVYIERDNWEFHVHRGQLVTPETQEKDDAAKLLDFIKRENMAGRHPTKTEIKHANGTHKVARSRVDRALVLVASAVVYDGGTGKKGGGYTAI
jgi:RecA-family ATPase